MTDAVNAGSVPEPADVVSNRSHGWLGWGEGRFDFSRWIFLRLLGVIHLFAFVSLACQIEALVGSRGILPITPYLQDVAKQFGSQAKFLLPTLLWISSSDQALRFLCVGGAILSGLLIVGVAPVPVLVLLWSFYLSLTVAGQTFLGFQWDSLLLEAGLLAIFLAPMEWMLWRKPRRPTSFLVILLFRWLIFRLMFLSGVLKLTSGDPNWRHWTALQYHYQTQPLPAWTSWYFQHLPPWFQTVSVGYMFAAELIAPVLIFGPRIARLIAFGMIVLLQVLIAGSGNYGFFNLLAIVLCIPILDDSFWPGRCTGSFTAREKSPSRFWPKPFLIPLIALIVVISGMTLVEAFDGNTTWPPPMIALEEKIDPFRSINGYGLFRVMTTQRLEIIVEGSDDGLDWKPYEFKWKPGDPHRAPRFCTPDMPRLDWQMWFAALSDVENNPWFVNFLIRLLQGSPPVLDLMGHNPFPDHPPQYVRAVLYRYEFTSAAERRKTGDWWKREQTGIYCPPVSLKDLR
jgi:hypothetical protein